MNARIAVIVLCLVVPLLAAGQDKSGVVNDEAGVRQAVLDYAEGYYEGSGERMARAVHPLLCKRGVVTAGPQGEPFLVLMNSEMLTEAARSGRGKLDPEKRGISVKVLDMNESTASAKVFTSQFNDYLHLARIDGTWRIVNVLWRPPAAAPAADAGKGTEAIIGVVRDLRKAGNEKDAARAKQFMHPGLLKRTFAPSGPGSRSILQDTNAETMVQVILLGRAAAPQGQPDPEVAVLDVYENIGSVKISTAGYVEYQHVVKEGGRWQIVNTLAVRGTPPSK